MYLQDLRKSQNPDIHFRADKIIEDFAAEKNIELKGSVDGWTQEEMRDFLHQDFRNPMYLQDLRKSQNPDIQILLILQVLRFCP